MMIQATLITLMLFFANPQEETRIVNINKEKAHTSGTCPYQFVFKPDAFIQTKSVETPFSIENDCLSFCISHEGCDCSFQMYWDGTYRKDALNRIIADLKFVLSYKKPCRRNNHTNLNFDLSEIIQSAKSETLYINFIGYDNLIEIKF